MVPSAGSHQPTFRASQFLTIAQAGGQVEFTGRQRLEPLNCALMRRIALPTSGTFRAGPPIWEIEKGRGAVTRLRNCSPHQQLGGSVMAPQSDTSSLHVLVCSSMAGTIVGLAATWIVVAHSFVQPMVA